MDMSGLRARGSALCAMALLALVLFCGCAGARPQMLEYLRASANDLKVVDDLLADKDLGLMEEEDPAGEEDVTIELLDWYLGILNDYSGKIDAAIAAMDTRQMPENEELKAYRDAAKDEFETVIDIIGEYVQVLEYERLLLQVGNDLDQLENADAADLQALFEAYNASLTKAIDDIGNANVPSFMQSANTNFAGVLGEMNDAVLYYLNAYAMDDPVRANAAEYRMGILERKIDRISAGFDQDMEEREDKLQQQLEAVKTKNDALAGWLQANIDKLD